MSGPANVAPVIIKRKKVSGDHGHHGGAWKVAYADFVTAMMAFFMLMWLLNATTEKQRQGLADYFSPTIPIHRVASGSEQPFGGESTHSEEAVQKDGEGTTEQNTGEIKIVTDPESPAEIAEDPLKLIEEALNGRGGESFVSDEAMKHVVMRITDEGLIIELFDTEEAKLFEQGTDNPTPLLRDLLGMIARVSSLVTNGVAVGGHVPANPIVLANNPVWDLSTNRAGRARALLETAGLAPERIRRVTGFADRKPSLDNPMALRNNRIEITLLRSDTGN